MDFDTCVKQINALKKRPTDEELLSLYGLYKQATIGDINTPQPWIINRIARVKWDEWNKRKGLDKETSKMRYCRQALRILHKYGN